MARKLQASVAERTNLERIVEDLHAPDEAARSRAVRDVCPCRLGWEGFQQCVDEVRRLRKDPSSRVRGAVLHVLQEALEMDSSGLRTTRQEVTNEMAAKKRRTRWALLEDVELAPRKREKPPRRKRR